MMIDAEAWFVASSRVRSSGAPRGRRSVALGCGFGAAIRDCGPGRTGIGLPMRQR
jgi:hypothetical protein